MYGGHVWKVGILQAGGLGDEELPRFLSSLAGERRKKEGKGKEEG